MSPGCVAGLRNPRRQLFQRREGWLPMTKVTAGITTSVDGYITGPDDGPGKGLGVGGERLHYWVFGGPWTYDDEPSGEATGEDARGWTPRWRGSARSSAAAGRTRRPVTGATRTRGGCRSSSSPTARRSSPTGGAFTFVDGVREGDRAGASRRRATRTSASMGGADVIRQALDAGLVDELTIIVAPVDPRRRQAPLRRLHQGRSSSSTSAYASRRTRPSSTTG